MPATTRSRTKQTHIEDFSNDSKKQTTKSSTKRKIKNDNTDRNQSPKKQRASSKAVKNGDDGTSSPPKEEAKPTSSDDHAVIINRAPVLELWGACVAHALYPSTSWNTCLSIGGAISTLCAISKGRAIGQIDKPDPETAKQRKQDRVQKAQQESLDEVEVMSFKLSIKNGSALVSGKPKPANETALRKKFRDDNYDRTKSTFETALSKWNDDLEELNSSAFAFYETFRPSVAAGQRGWGRKGELNLNKVTETIASPG